MSGSYCRYCDHRCFVERRLPPDATMHAGRIIHMATCPRGAEHDRAVTGYDHRTAINPASDPAALAYALAYAEACDG
jgi:hypothetical protein